MECESIKCMEQSIELAGKKGHVPQPAGKLRHNERAASWRYPRFRAYHGTPFERLSTFAVLMQLVRITLENVLELVHLIKHHYGKPPNF